MRIILTAGDSIEDVIDLLRSRTKRLTPTGRLIIDITDEQMKEETAVSESPAMSVNRPWLQEQSVIFRRLLDKVPSLTLKEIGTRLGSGHSSATHYSTGEVLISPNAMEKIPSVFGVEKDDPDVIRLKEIVQEYSGRRVRHTPENPMLAEQSEILKRLLLRVPLCTQGAIAAILGINVTAFNLCINGRRLFSPRALKKIPIAFDVPADDPDVQRLNQIVGELKSNRRGV